MTPTPTRRPATHVAGHVALALLAASLLLAACGPSSSDDRSATRDTSPSPGPPPATATFTVREHQIDGPETLPAGVTTVTAVNEGAETHHLVFARIEDGKTGFDFTAALAKLDPTGVARLLGGPDGVAAGASTAATVVLTPGTYLVACFIPGPDGVSHFVKGMSTELEVTPSAAPTTLPPGDRTVHLGEYTIGRGGVELEGFRGTGRLTVVNEGAELHQLDIVRLRDGATADDVVKAASVPLGAPRPEPPYQGVGGVSFLSPGASAQVDVGALGLQPGRYAFVCLIPSPTDRVSHAAKGMIAEFRVGRS